MSIIRAPRPTCGYLTVRNEVLRDSRLSYRARGLLLSILSRPDNWRTDSEFLASEGKEGRDAVRTALAELEDAGYLLREKRQDEKTGKWATAVMVFDSPEAWKTVPGDSTPVPEEPTPGKPTPGKPSVGLSGPIRNTYKNNLEEKNLPAPVVAAPNAGTVISAWIEGLAHRPPERVIGQTSREVRLLLEQGFEPLIVLEACKSISAKGLHPSTLASEVNTMVNPPTRSRGGPQNAEDRMSGLKHLLTGGQR
jgi:hypothetical protein